MTAISTSDSRTRNVFLNVFRAILIGGGLFIAAILLLLAGFELYYAGRVYPGVTVAGVDVSGLRPAAAAARLNEAITYPQTGQILLRDGPQTWVATPIQLGYYLDAETTAENAYRIGRDSLPFANLYRQGEAWFSGINLAPVMVFDQRVGQRFLIELAKQIDKPVVEAKLGLEGTDVAVHSGQVGRTLDVDASLKLLSVQLQTMQDGIVPVLVRETPPLIMDVSQQAEIAKRILNEPLVLSIAQAQNSDPGPWTFDVPTLAKMLTIERLPNGDGGAIYQVGVNSETLRTFLTDLAPSLSRQAVNSRFTFNDDTDQLEVLKPAVIGRELNVDASITTINEKLAKGEHNIPLEFVINKPAVTDDMTGAQLGIKELVHQESSYFRGSSAARVQNIKAASSRFHGLLVAPGETFSMGDALGDISLDNGYAEALIILGNQTIKGVGGGVCQVSTTLFRTVFFAGYPVVERHAHAYRVSYYEQKAGSGINPDFAGLDATVFFPLVDFKFKNDTPNWILMETYVNGYSLTWKFYSTSDGRTVDWQTSGLRNVTPPGDPIYRENPDLAKGEKKQVEWPVEGADVSVRRTVSRNGAVYFQDSFNTHYVPWAEAWEYGPGTEDIPTKESSPTP
ncbi:MAG TPA: VanW family protein [Anaerolineaceae bacterium]|nr:VanW family protein [Anaerolineaceae bacterium]